jgi:hypothetical protein
MCCDGGSPRWMPTGSGVGASYPFTRTRLIAEAKVEGITLLNKYPFGGTKPMEFVWHEDGSVAAL